MDRCWSDLPSDLLQRIGKQFNDCAIDVSMFRAVCRSWRFSLPPCRKQVFPPIFCKKNNATFILSADTFFYRLTSRPSVSDDDEDDQKSERCKWLVMISDGKTPRLLDNRVESTEATVRAPKELNILEFRVTELANLRTYTLSSSRNNVVVIDCKVALSSSLNPDQLMFIVKDASENLDRGLYHCKLRKDKNKQCYFFCTKLVYDIQRYGPLQDVIFHQGKFYVVQNCGTALVVDYPSSSLLKFKLKNAARVPLYQSVNAVYACVYAEVRLVELFGELFLFAMRSSSRCHFTYDVFKMNKAAEEWIRLDLQNTKERFTKDLLLVHIALASSSSIRFEYDSDSDA